jgi:Creatinase/Prolidase N-terminal domain
MTGDFADRLASLRQELARRRLDGFIVPRADEYLGEYVAPSSERLAWLTRFTGSAGVAAVLIDKAAVLPMVAMFSSRNRPIAACGSADTNLKSRPKTGWQKMRRPPQRSRTTRRLISEEEL